MKLRLAQPSVLIDIGRLSDLSYIRDAGDHIAIGALTRHMDIETSDVLREHVPLLAHAASHVGDPQVRHRGTIGGSIAHADPASDLPATTLALGATYVAQGPNGTREIPASEFYESFLTSTLAPDEMLTEIQATALLEYFLKELAPTAYNAGVVDAQAFVRDRLGDLEATVHEREFAYWPKGSSVRRRS